MNRPADKMNNYFKTGLELQHTHDMYFFTVEMHMHLKYLRRSSN